MPDSSKFELFRDDRNVYKRVRPRRRLLHVVAVLGLAVLGGNLWWLGVRQDRPALEREVAESDRITAHQDKHLERLNQASREIETHLERLKATDAKLREMISLDKGVRHTVGTVAPGQAESPESRAQLARMEAQDAYLRMLSKPASLNRLDGGDIKQMAGPGGIPLGAVPDSWPVEGVISSGFGNRLSPFAGIEEFHKGVDITAPPGSDVLAPAPGIVRFAGEDPGGGLSVILDHHGGYETSFSHMQRLNVTQGQLVERGDPIGLVGQDMRSTGPHLHYEVWLHAMPVDPKKYLP